MTSVQKSDSTTRGGESVKDGGSSRRKHPCLEWVKYRRKSAVGKFLIDGLVIFTTSMVLFCILIPIILSDVTWHQVLSESALTACKVAGVYSAAYALEFLYTKAVSSIK